MGRRRGAIGAYQNEWPISHNGQYGRRETRVAVIKRRHTAPSKAFDVAVPVDRMGLRWLIYHMTNRYQSPVGGSLRIVNARLAHLYKSTRYTNPVRSAGWSNQTYECVTCFRSDGVAGRTTRYTLDVTEGGRIVAEYQGGTVMDRAYVAATIGGVPIAADLWKLPTDVGGNRCLDTYRSGSFSVSIGVGGWTFAWSEGGVAKSAVIPTGAYHLRAMLEKLESMMEAAIGGPVAITLADDGKVTITTPSMDALNLAGSTAALYTFLGLSGAEVPVGGAVTATEATRWSDYGVYPELQRNVIASGLPAGQYVVTITTTTALAHGGRYYDVAMYAQDVNQRGDITSTDPLVDDGDAYRPLDGGGGNIELAWYDTAGYSLGTHSNEDAAINISILIDGVDYAATWADVATLQGTRWLGRQVSFAEQTTGRIAGTAWGTVDWLWTFGPGGCLINPRITMLADRDVDELFAFMPMSGNRVLLGSDHLYMSDAEWVVGTITPLATTDVPTAKNSTGVKIVAANLDWQSTIDIVSIPRVVHVNQETILDSVSDRIDSRIKAYHRIIKSKAGTTVPLLTGTVINVSARHIVQVAT